jgi:hypothetical protein
VDKNNGKPVVIPKVGMSFKLEDDAYEMYNSYAERVGFSIRKWTTRLRSDKTIGTGFALGETIRFGSLEFIANHFSSMGLSPEGNDLGTVFVGMVHSGLSSLHTILEESANEDDTTSSGGGTPHISRTQCGDPAYPHHNHTNTLPEPPVVGTASSPAQILAHVWLSHQDRHLKPQSCGQTR